MPVKGVPGEGGSNMPQSLENGQDEARTAAKRWGNLIVGRVPTHFAQRGRRACYGVGLLLIFVAIFSCLLLYTFRAARIVGQGLKSKRVPDWHVWIFRLAGSLALVFAAVLWMYQPLLVQRLSNEWSSVKAEEVMELNRSRDLPHVMLEQWYRYDIAANKCPRFTWSVLHLVFLWGVCLCLYVVAAELAVEAKFKDALATNFFDEDFEKTLLAAYGTLVGFLLGFWINSVYKTYSEYRAQWHQLETAIWSLLYLAERSAFAKRCLSDEAYKAARDSRLKFEDGILKLVGKICESVQPSGCWSQDTEDAQFELYFSDKLARRWLISAGFLLSSATGAIASGGVEKALQPSEAQAGGREGIKKEAEAGGSGGGVTKITTPETRDENKAEADDEGAARSGGGGNALQRGSGRETTEVTKAETREKKKAEAGTSKASDAKYGPPHEPAKQVNTSERKSKAEAGGASLLFDTEDEQQCLQALVDRVDRLYPQFNESHRGPLPKLFFIMLRIMVFVFIFSMPLVFFPYSLERRAEAWLLLQGFLVMFLVYSYYGILTFGRQMERIFGHGLCNCNVSALHFKVSCYIIGRKLFAQYLEYTDSLNLELGHHYLTDAGIQALVCVLKSWKDTIKDWPLQLDVSRNGMKADGAHALASVIGGLKLTKVNLSGNYPCFCEPVNWHLVGPPSSQPKQSSHGLVSLFKELPAADLTELDLSDMSGIDKKVVLDALVAKVGETANLSMLNVSYNYDLGMDGVKSICCARKGKGACRIFTTSCSLSTKHRAIVRFNRRRNEELYGLCDKPEIVDLAAEKDVPVCTDPEYSV